MEQLSESWVKSPKKRKFRKLRAKHLFREYCEKSTVHGTKYFAEKDRPVWERLLWIVLFVMSLFACGKMIERAWLKLNNSPLAVTFAEKAVHITQVPFPAVTICSSVKFRSQDFSFKKYQKDPEKYKHWEETYRNLGQLCDNYDPLPGNLDSDILDIIREHSPDDRDMIKMITFRDDKLNTTDSFHESFTTQGLCYTFNRLPLQDIYRVGTVILLSYDFVLNSLSVSQQPSCVFGQQNESFLLNAKVNWSVEMGFTDYREIYPRRAANIRQESGLQIILQINKKDVDILCQNSAGYMLQFHSPSDIPRMDEHSVIIPVDRFAQIAIEPRLINTPRNVEVYPPEQRECYFNSERKLQHFKIYSERNCKMECLANWTLTLCGCVSFFMPSK